MQFSNDGGLEFDMTGDGEGDAKGYDTTGDGKIDSWDTVSDLPCNVRGEGGGQSLVILEDPL